MDNDDNYYYLGKGYLSGDYAIIYMLSNVMNLEWIKYYQGLPNIYFFAVGQSSQYFYFSMVSANIVIYEGDKSTGALMNKITDAAGVFDSSSTIQLSSDETAVYYTASRYSNANLCKWVRATQ